MNIDAFNAVVATAVSSTINVRVVFEADGDSVAATVRTPSSRPKEWITVRVPLTLSDIEIYSIKFQSLVAFICDKIWNALKDYEAPKQENAKDE